MNTCFKVFASYYILQHLCEFIHVLIFVTLSKCQISPKLMNIVIYVIYFLHSKMNVRNISHNIVNHTEHCHGSEDCCK